jgi:hypothetical protein
MENPSTKMDLEKTRNMMQTMTVLQIEQNIFILVLE